MAGRRGARAVPSNRRNTAHIPASLAVLPSAKSPFKPTASRTDRCPGACGDGGDTGRIVGEEVPGLAGFVDDIVAIIEHGDGEFVCAQNRN
jgi:hypothetical protein